MGLFGKKEEKEETVEEAPQGKYDETCSLCGKGPCDKKWMGQYWHKKCIRSAKRSAKKMM